MHEGTEMQLRLSPTARGKHNFASRSPLCLLRPSSNRPCIVQCIFPLEERGDAKIHPLSPRMHPAGRGGGGGGPEEGHRLRAHALLQQPVHEVAADESGPAGDDDPARRRAEPGGDAGAGCEGEEWAGAATARGRGMTCGAASSWRESGQSEAVVGAWLETPASSN